ncbi:MAG: hypothetical protein AAFX07_17555, partial [Pseudomonadota bacterium]
RYSSLEAVGASSAMHSPMAKKRILASFDSLHPDYRWPLLASFGALMNPGVCISINRRFEA